MTVTQLCAWLVALGALAYTTWRGRAYTSIPFFAEVACLPPSFLIGIANYYHDPATLAPAAGILTGGALYICAHAAFIDARTHRLPNAHTATLAILTGAVLGINGIGAGWEVLIAPIIGAALVSAVFGAGYLYRRSIGLGDVKICGSIIALIILAGESALVAGLFTFALVTAVMAGIVGVRQGRRAHFALGVPLAIALWAALSATAFAALPPLT